MKRFTFFLLVSLLGCTSLQAQQAAARLAERVLGREAEKFEFRHQPGTTDFFTLRTVGQRVYIAGNNDNSMAVGLNYYLKEYLNVHVSWYQSEPVRLPKRLAPVTQPVTRFCQVPLRFFLNYCTYGYTMVWWQWEQWEHFIDWMALNGINMPLALTGQEAVWQQVWREMGMTDDEIRAYFSSPAHLPWHHMANLDGFGGPLPQAWIDGQRALQRKIVARERELNMTPVLPAFAGHVPRQIAERNAGADIRRLNGWCGFEPTYFLSPTDSLFAVIQKSYLSKQTKLYGSNHVYGIDPFNEMDPPSWDPDYLASVSKGIFNSLLQTDPDAWWLQMSWVFYYKRSQWTPERLKAYLTAVPQGRMVLLDYFCEKTEVWRQTDAFYGQPFIWCYLGNFGGNTMLVGDLKGLHARLDSLRLAHKPNLLGIGSTLEGFDPSPQTFEFLFEHPWHLTRSENTVAEFTRRWSCLRQGEPSTSAHDAWRLLIDSVYRDWSYYGMGTQMVARPSLSGHGTYYTKPYYSYDNSTLLRAVRLLMEAPSKSPSYRYDVANFLSQWLGNHFMEVRDAYTDAYRQGDTALMHRYEGVALGMMDDADELLSTIEPFDYYHWVEQARSWGNSPSEKDYYETSARTLLTVWGGPVLNDYANRMWGGLLRDYYHARWSRFFRAVDSSFTARVPFDQHGFDSTLSLFEQQWARTGTPATQRQRQGVTLEVAGRILDREASGYYAVPNRARQVLSDYLRRFPEAQLQDVYKLCFQDIYGPGHIIKDSASCVQYIIREMEQVDTADTRYPDYEYAGVEGNYVRVNIKVLKQGRFDLGRFVQLLMLSARQEKPMPIYDWRGQWQRLQTMLGTFQPRPHNFEADASLLQQMFDRGEYVFHHSTRFNQAYGPHYRLIRRDLFEQELLPVLQTR